MSVFKIEIKETERIAESTILTATVRNGNWRAWEDWQDSTEETPLTINTAKEFSTIHAPIKAVFPNWEFVNGELEQNGEEIRLYDSLLDFLSVAVGWTKDSYRNKRTFEIIISELKGSVLAVTRESELVFGNYTKAEVKIEKVD